MDEWKKGLLGQQHDIIEEVDILAEDDVLLIIKQSVLLSDSN